MTYWLFPRQKLHRHFYFCQNSPASDFSDLNEMLKLITPRLNILGLSNAVCRTISILGEDFFKLMCLKRSDR